MTPIHAAMNIAEPSPLLSRSFRFTLKLELAEAPLFTNVSIIYIPEPYVPLKRETSIQVQGVEVLFLLWVILNLFSAIKN